jgi:hypothetical protein
MLTLPNPPLIDTAALAGAQAAHHFATVLRAQWSAFWGRDVATVLSDLHADLPKTLAIFQLNTQAALAVNSLLDAVADERFPVRAPAELPPYWSFAPEVGFAFTPPPPPVEEPAPEPEPEP